MKASSLKAKAWVNIILLLAAIAANILGTYGYINGLTQKEVSDKFVSLITPSPFTFGIWSLIYALLIASVIVMLIKHREHYYEQALNRISGLFWLSCILNIAWIIAFSFVLIELSAALIFILTIVLIVICRKLLRIQSTNRWLLPLTFGIYAGWLFIATFVNIAQMLVKWKWQGFGVPQETWGIVVLALALLIGLIVLFSIKNAGFMLPVAWAYFGIYMHLKSFEGLNILRTIALIGAVAALVLAAIRLMLNRFTVIPLSDRE